MFFIKRSPTFPGIAIAHEGNPVLAEGLCQGKSLAVERSAAGQCPERALQVPQKGQLEAMRGTKQGMAVVEAVKPAGCVA